MKAGTFIVPPPPPPPPSTNVVPLTCDNVREELLPLLDKIKITRNHLRTCSPAKMDFFKKKLIILVKQRTTIMNKLPREFKGYKERCGNDFMLFEQLHYYANSQNYRCIISKTPTINETCKTKMYIHNAQGDPVHSRSDVFVWEIL